MEHFNSTSGRQEDKPSFIERFFSSSLFKLGCTLFLVLLLLIPLNWVNEIIHERNQRKESVEMEISSKWGANQVLSGPILGVPYTVERTIKEVDAGNQTKSKQIFETDYIFLMAKNTAISTNVVPKELKRGIYKSIVYSSISDITGEFGDFIFPNTNVKPENLSWERAKIFVGVSDLKGITTKPTLLWEDKEVLFTPNAGDVNIFERVLEAPVDLSTESAGGVFKIRIGLRGSNSFRIFPTADETKIKVKGAWTSPSFSGGYLPEERQIEANNFKAFWQVPSYSRLFPAQWSGKDHRMYDIAKPADGKMSTSTSVREITKTPNALVISDDDDMIQIDFLETLNNYNKMNRVSKYGILVILLTFTALFFMELIKNKKVHIIHYILIGCAMVLFYTLLLALSEQIGFDWSYLISATTTIALVSFFLFWVTKDIRISYLFSAILVVFYLFIYCLMLLEDYALIVGTTGVFIVLTILMRWSTKVNWYQLER